MLKARLEEVEERIASAAARAGRRRDDIALIAVTKLFPARAICEAYDLGLRLFGENYVQEFEGKHADVTNLDGAEFHLIGHLQSNKARRAAELFHAVQTVDSVKLARRLNEAAARPLEVMIEVKLSEEGSKTGAAPGQVPELIEAIRACSNLRLTGLMTMPPWTDDAEPSRAYFRRLRELGERHGLAKLSMGMSHDLEVAIEEGATHVRVGTALFGERRRA
ncbi:MAG TPA: YggS family pyridoxal phosphate-dependent enzyme [Bryobacteraceae bacterium]|nr:YggS family pyridoxal phosphate-dependent enzyme [Bryobacteraceae bacterium]